MTEPGASSGLRAGAAVQEIPVPRGAFLVGYPHVERFSEGGHDPLQVRALALEDGHCRLAVVSVDVLFLTAGFTARCRQRLAESPGLDAASVLLAATHTHSGPVTNRMVAWERDPVVPPPDSGFLRQLEDRVVEAVRQAWRGLRPVEAASGFTRLEGLGGNRLDPSGPSDPEAPCLWLRDAETRRPVALLLSIAMHPTVMHEDSRQASADFPGVLRRELEQTFPGLTVVSCMGAAGNQSPRHVLSGNTFEEMARLGRLAATALTQAWRELPDAAFSAVCPLEAKQTRVDMPPRRQPETDQARETLRQARDRYQTLRDRGASAPEIRTAECAVFGAEEGVALAEAQAEGRLDDWIRDHRVAEVQVLRTGDLYWVAWPAEVFVEFALDLRRRAGGPVGVITLANGESQGYLVTPEEEARGGYEAQFSLFLPAAADMLVEASLSLLPDAGVPLC